MLAGSTSPFPAWASSGLPSSGHTGQSDLRSLYIRAVFDPVAAAPVRNPWLMPLRRGAGGASGLICFPYGGGSAAVFHGWGERLPAGVELHGVQLPGRTTRVFEPAYTSLPPLVDALVQALGPALRRPTVLFGHSMGALLAFELARELRRRGAPGPVALILSGCPAAHLPIGSRVHDLPEPELLARLVRLGGTPPELLQDRELLDLVLPAVRADFAVAETYRHSAEPPLDVPIAAFAGRHDEHAAVDDVDAWREHTSAGFTLDVLPGEHFFIHTEADRFLDLLGRRVAELLP
jgi:medium-chain acyl-[acyl-carrier-protein] hydrolase